MTDAETMLLWCATPSGVIDLEDEQFLYTYFLDQHHESLEDYMHYKIVEQELHSIRSQVILNTFLKRFIILLPVIRELISICLLICSVMNVKLLVDIEKGTEV